MDSKEIEILWAILDYNWQKLLDFLPSSVKAEKQIENNPSEYEWEGDHSTDARYTYPYRERLIHAVLFKLISERQR